MSDPRAVPLRAGRDRRRPAPAIRRACRPRAKPAWWCPVAGPADAAPGDGQAGLRHPARLDGAIQLFAGAAWTEDFDGFGRLSLGDWIGATGEVVRTRTGELSVKISSWVLLAEARRSFGDKWKGISDVDLRYRQRYADLWAHEGSRETLLLRSRVLSWIRRWLEDRGFVEVETPVFHPHPGRRRGPAVRHPPQRPRHRPLPADRPRAVPQAAGGRRLRTGLRDRPGVPQRGAVAPAQPGVHHARALPGLRRLHRHDGAGRGAGVRPGRGPARDHRADLRRPAPVPGRALASGPP